MREREAHSQLVNNAIYEFLLKEGMVKTLKIFKEEILDFKKKKLINFKEKLIRYLEMG